MKNTSVKLIAIGIYNKKHKNKLYFFKSSWLLLINYNYVTGQKITNNKFKMGGAQTTAPYFSSNFIYGNLLTRVS